MLLKCCTQYASKFEKLSSGHRTVKGQFSFQSQRIFKLPYNCTHFICQKDYVQNPSNQALAVCELRPSRCTSCIQKKQRNQRSNCQHPWIIDKGGNSKKIYFCFIDYAKAFDCVNHNKLWKILQESGIAAHLTCLLRNLCKGQYAELQLDMEQQTSSKLGKEHVKAVYCHPAYLTYMQSTS